VASQRTRVASTPFKWSKDQVEYHDSLYPNNIPLWGISTIWSLSRLTQMISNEHKIKGEYKHTQERELQQQHAYKTRTSTRNSTTELQLKEVLESLSQWTKCVFAKSRRCRMFNVCLVLCSMRLGVPFIAPRELGAIGAPFGRLWFPSVRRRSGQSGAPTDNEQYLISFLFWWKRPLQPSALWHTGQSGGAPDSPVRPSNHRWRPHVARWSRGQPLAGRVAGTQDNPVNYSHGA
jgi:hypothetical protein